jgi:hypothetical protein
MIGIDRPRLTADAIASATCSRDGTYSGRQGHACTCICASPLLLRCRCTLPQALGLRCRCTLPQALGLRCRCTLPQALGMCVCFGWLLLCCCLMQASLDPARDPAGHDKQGPRHWPVTGGDKQASCRGFSSQGLVMAAQSCHTCGAQCSGVTKFMLWQRPSSCSFSIQSASSGPVSSNPVRQVNIESNKVSTHKEPRSPSRSNCHAFETA